MRREFGDIGEKVALFPTLAHKGALLSFWFPLMMWLGLEVPSLTPQTRDAHYCFAGVCHWAESPPGFLSRSFLAAKWGLSGQGL